LSIVISINIICNLFVYQYWCYKLICLKTLTSGLIQVVRKKNSWFAHGFAQEYLRSCAGYRPGRSLKRRGKSCSLHSKKMFWLGSLGSLWVTS